jgi:hypothetical protein
MAKLERTDENYGSGSGCGVFESDLFRVTWWRMNGGRKRTLLDIRNSDDEIQFDGHQELKSDEDCLNQVSVAEIVSLIESVKRDGIRQGKRTKIREIKEVLDLG